MGSILKQMKNNNSSLFKGKLKCLSKCNIKRNCEERTRNLTVWQNFRMKISRQNVFYSNCI